MTTRSRNFNNTLFNYVNDDVVIKKRLITVNNYSMNKCEIG